MQNERIASRRAYGSGSLFESGGDWYGKWRTGGRQVKRKVGRRRTRGESDGLTRAQAEARLRELMAAVRAEDVQRVSAQRRPGDLTVKELGERYLTHAREHRGLKATTLADYEMCVRVHLTPFFGDLAIQRIDARRIEAFARHLRQKQGQGRRAGGPLSPKTVSNYIGTLAVLLNFAVRKKWLGASPMPAVDLPAAVSDAPLEELSFLEPEQVSKPVEGAYCKLDRALYLTAAYTGLRQGELRGLRWEHLDFDRSLVHVLENVTRGRRSSPKGKRRRSVPLAGTAARALLELRAASQWTTPRDCVFACPSTGQPMARAGLMGRYRTALTGAGLPAGFSFHDLRHTFGTTMARAGVPVGTIQAWMGHADLQTTQLYMHYAPAQGDAARIDAAFGTSTNPGTNVSVVSETEINSEAA